MIHNIDIEGIVTMLRVLPKQYDTDTIKIARGKYKLPTTVKGLLKKLKHG
jgi:hypothetical protein